MSVFTERFCMFRLGEWNILKVNAGKWELYNMEQDQTELNDLEQSRPEKLQELTDSYQGFIATLP